MDFVFPSFRGQSHLPLPPEPMSYGEAQYLLRRYVGLPWKTSHKTNYEASWWYSLHGLKATLVSWALQLQIPEEQRRLHAKHRGQNQSTTLYSRDDVSGALCLQQTIIDRVRGGWRPHPFLGRGGQEPLVEPDFQLEQFSKQLAAQEWTFFQFSEPMVSLVDSEHTDPAVSDSTDISSSASSQR